MKVVYTVLVVTGVHFIYKVTSNLETSFVPSHKQGKWMLSHPSRESVWRSFAMVNCLLIKVQS